MRLKPPHLGEMQVRVVHDGNTLRVQLAAAYRIFDHFGWCELIYGHISMRVPGPKRTAESHVLEGLLLTQEENEEDE